MLEHAKQPLDIGHRAFDLAIHKAQKPERHEELQHELVHQYEITQRHGAPVYRHRGHAEHQGLTGGNDERLPAVQGKERQAVLAARLLPDIERGVVALRLEGLVIKVFHRLVIE